MVNFGETVNVAGKTLTSRHWSLSGWITCCRYEVVGDMIVLHYQSNDANTDKCLKVRATTKDTFDGINTFLWQKLLMVIWVIGIRTVP